MVNKTDSILGEYTEYGFSIKEPNDHVLELYFKDLLIGTFYQPKVTKDIIQEGCKNYRKSLDRWA